MKQKKYKTTSIGHSNDSMHINDIGNPHLHKQKKICIRPIEDTKLGRAIVLDQHIIDVMYTDDYLNAKQHNVCNKYLGIISKSGAWIKTPSYERTIFTSNNSLSQPLPKSCILITTQRLIIDKCGNQKEKVFWKIMSGNPVKVNETEIEIAKECANALLEYWYVNQESPVSLFQQALISQTSS